MTDLDDLLWAVSINNGQRFLVVRASSAGDACKAAEDNWHEDKTVTAKQRKKGIYALRTRLAKFSEVSEQLVLACTGNHTTEDSTE